MGRPGSWIPVAVLAAGCAQNGTGAESRVCTLIGCESGLEVSIESAPAGAFRVEVQAPGEAVRTVECSAGTPCPLFFRDFTPASATIRVIAGSQTTTATVTPQYRTLQPNGPDCPPTCRRASVAVRRNDAV